MSLQTTVLNYELADGAAKLEAVQLDGETALLTVSMSAIPDANAALSLEQSVDGVTYFAIADTSATLAAEQTGFLWKLTNMVRGAFVRISVASTSETGVIGTMNVLTSTR